MVVFPNAKINLGLNITEKRSDGYHNIQTIFYPLPLKDVLEIIPSTSGEHFKFTVTGNAPVLQKGFNLCEKAFELIEDLIGTLPASSLHLHKEIPTGGGLGGGSADGAFTLILLNQYFDLKLSDQELASLALQLGSDCPFFVYNKPCVATGRGDILKPISLDLSLYKICVINPKFPISTAEAFGNLPSLNPTPFSLTEIHTLPISFWKETIFNDFEQSVFPKHPVLKEIKSYLYGNGALYASLSGTGSSMYGIFKEKVNLPSLEANPYFIKWL